MIGLALRLLGLTKWLKEAAGRVFTIARAYPWQAAVLALLVALAWQWHGKGVEHRKYLAERAARAVDRQAYEQASAANLAAQIAQNKAWEAKITTAAKEADHEYAKGLADGRTRAAAYAVSHGVRWQSADRSSAAPAPGEGPVAPDRNGPGEGAVMVSRADFDTLTDNTLRLQAVHVWGWDLIAKKLAEPVQ